MAGANERNLYHNNDTSSDTEDYTDDRRRRVYKNRLRYNSIHNRSLTFIVKGVLFFNINTNIALRSYGSCSKPKPCLVQRSTSLSDPRCHSVATPKQLHNAPRNRQEHPFRILSFESFHY